MNDSSRSHFKPETPTAECTSLIDTAYNWTKGNVANPFLNAAVVEPVNAVMSVSSALSSKQLPRVELLATSENTNSASWLVQTLAGGAGAIVPYLAAGKLTGKALANGGRFFERNNFISTDGLAAKFASSEKSAMILGAGLYGGAHDPGGKETRLGNAVGNMVGFGVFESGNELAKGSPLMRLIALRAVIGAGGGIAQVTTSNLISEQKVATPENMIKAATSGAALNLFLPAASHGMGRIADAANVRMGNPISVEGFIAREKWTDNAALQSLAAQSPLTRVQRSNLNDSSIDQSRNVIHLGKADGPEILGHELSHRITHKQSEVDFKAASNILKTNPEAAKNHYIDIRMTQERSALQAEKAVRRSTPGVTLDAVLNDPLVVRSIPEKSYSKLFSNESEQFARSAGKFRPIEDHSRFRTDPETGLMTFEYAEPANHPFGGQEKMSHYETTEDKSFQRWTMTDIVHEGGTAWGIIEVFDTPRLTPYGTAMRVGSFPDKSMAYHIIEGHHGMPDNAVFRAYTKGVQTEHGFVTSTTTFPDGKVIYGIADGTFVTVDATP